MDCENYQELELKLIADIGLLGYPNAGKSTLLAAVTRAFPKIAPYPFTTLRPYLGHIEYIDGTKLVMADLPGIIEGAHQNKGLGLEFLKHVERTKAILYVIDGSGTGEMDAVETYHLLAEEIRKYNYQLLSKPSLIALNKCDLNTPRFDKKCEELRGVAHTEVIPISAKDSINLDTLVNRLKDIVPKKVLLKPRLQAQKTNDSEDEINSD